MYSDVSIAGDPLALPHLLPPVPQHPGTVAEFAGLARSIAADRERWAPLVRYDATTRWYARLQTGPGYEVWLLSWLPGQGSGLHDHGGSSGVLTVLQGALRERALGRAGRDRPPYWRGRPACLRTRLCARGRQRQPGARGQPARVLPRPHRDDAARLHLRRGRGGGRSGAGGAIAVRAALAD